MRNKLKKIWNKEDGFTLVELLGVIVILGLIIAIAVPALGNIINNASKTTKDAQETLILDAAQIYFLETEDADNTVTVAELISNNYLEKDKKGTEEFATETVVRDAKTGAIKFQTTPSN